jgi:3',5'-cyclic AMP phosphodiesterase CpdA
MPIPGTGRERNIITDAGDLLALLAQMDIDIVLSGHKHVPYFWGLNGILVCNSGTAATKRVRGLTPPSWNELQVDASTIKVFLHYPDGRRELSVIRSRTTRSLIREAFYLTEDFHASNRVLVE